jgi:ABC-type multidrug transport system permease subunit
MSDARPQRARTFRERALSQLTLVRYREFLREPEAIFWVFIFPVLLAAGLGLAFRNRPQETLKVGVLATAPGALAVRIALERDSVLRPELLDDSAGMRRLATGDIAMFIVPHSATEVTYRFDDTRPESRTARLLVDGAIQRAAGRSDPVAGQDSAVHQRGARYIDFVIPGLLGMNLMGSGIWGVGFAIVDARKKRLLKRLIATPMSRAEYLASFILSRLTMLVLELIALLGFGLLVFGVPMRGSWVQLLLICLIASLSFSAIGLLVASRVRTIEGVSGLANLVMLPMWVFSGVFFAWTRYPAAMQPFIRALPLTAANDALRATMLQGAGWSAVTPQLAILGAWLVVCFVTALKLFRWK